MSRLQQLATLFFLVLRTTALPAAEPSFRPLLTGVDRAQFEIVNLDGDALTIQDGEVRLAGKPEGYFATKKSYRNYVLRFEWLYERPKDYQAGKPFHGNSGLLLHIQGEPRVWPTALEIQIWYKSQYGDFYTHRGAKFHAKKDDHAKLAELLKPVGDWNSHEITCRDGTVHVRVNGVEIGHGINAEPNAGKIGWMAEGSPVRFRKLELQELP